MSEYVCICVGGKGGGISRGRDEIGEGEGGEMLRGEEDVGGGGV